MAISAQSYRLASPEKEEVGYETTEGCKEEETRVSHGVLRGFLEEVEVDQDLGSS
jgi:hypothetical protein